MPAAGGSPRRWAPPGRDGRIPQAARQAPQDPRDPRRVPAQVGPEPGTGACAAARPGPPRDARRVLTSYTDEIREILKLDPTDQLKSRSRYLAQEAKVRLNEADPLAEKQDWEWRPPRPERRLRQARPGRERRPERIQASCPCSRLSWPFRAGRPRLRTVPHRCAGASVLLV